MIKQILLVLLIGLILNTNAQPSSDVKKIEGVIQNSFRVFESIIDKKTNEVFGHIICYKKKTKLIVDFLDADLNTKRQIDIRLPRGFRVHTAMLNGDSFLILIGNASKKTIAYTYTVDGEPIGKKRFAGNHALLYLLPSLADNSYYAIIPAKGYKKRKGYEVKKLDNSLAVIWEKRYFSEEEGVLELEAANVQSNKLVLAQVYNPKELTKNVCSELLCLNGSGDTLFLSPLKHDISVVIPSKITFDKNNNIVTVGELYQGKTQRNMFSTGIFINKISETGQISNMKIHNWDNDVRNQLRKTQPILSGTNRLFFHDFLETKNGDFYAIGETYSTSKVGAIFEEIGQYYDDNKYIQMAAWARKFKSYFEAKYSGRYIGELCLEEASTITTQDLFVFNFDSDLNLNGIKKIKKDYTKIYVFPPHTYSAGIELSKAIAKNGFFDYAYTTNSANGSGNGVIYSSAYCTKPHIGAFTLENPNDIKVKIIEYKDFTDPNRKAAKRSVIRNHLAGAVPSNNGKMVVYYYLDDKKTKEEKNIEKEEEKKKKRKGQKKKKSKKKKKGAIYYYLENI